MTATDSARADDPLCASCGGETPALASVIYHGAVYHPDCVARTTGRSVAAARTAELPTRAAKDTPIGANLKQPETEHSPQAR